METEKKNEIIFLTEDLWAIILAKLPLRIVTTSKLVCKQWRSLVESKFFRELFTSHHQNSHTSWSLMYMDSLEEVVGYYACKIWGLPRTLDFYISSFILERFNYEYHRQRVKVKAYTDVGLILIRTGWRDRPSRHKTYYVANPISRQCVQIPQPPPTTAYAIMKPTGLATRVENDVLLGYKVVLMDVTYVDFLGLQIYSSETGLWSFKTLRYHLPLCSLNGINPISLNGNLYWYGGTIVNGFHDGIHREVVVSYDFYATNAESDRCQVTLFPDVGRGPRFKRVCTTSQGYITYMNIFSEEKDDGYVEHKLRVWRLKSGEWQLVSEISPACSKTGFEYFPLAMNPFDASTMYLWCKMHRCLAYTNLREDKFGLHHNLECSSNSNYRDLRIVAKIIFDNDAYLTTRTRNFNFSMFVLPRWLYQIPSSPSSPS